MGVTPTAAGYPWEAEVKAYHVTCLPSRPGDKDGFQFFNF